MTGTDRKIIAVCTSWEDVENLNLVLNQLILATEGTGFLPVCIPFDRKSLESRGEESLREFLAAYDIPNLAGLLLFGEMIRSDLINGKLIELAHEKKVPVFMLERQYEGCINLSFAYREGFEKVVRHIVEEHGCRDLVMVAGIKGNSYSEERIALTRQILEEHGSSLPPEQVIYGDYWDEPTLRALNGYFGAGGHMPEAFVCANDAMAITVCIYLAGRNVHVPEEVKVAGIDGILPGENHEPAITTARPDFSFMFGMMLQRMREWRKEDAGKTEILDVPFELIPRESCGCKRWDSFRKTRTMGDLKLENLEFTRQIRALGNFIRSTLDMDSLEELTKCLPPLFSTWPAPYGFAGAIDEKDRSLVKPILHNVHGDFSTGEPFRWEGRQVPDMERVRRDADVRIVLAQLLQNEEETMGYLVSGMHEWSLREQERFEEEAMFLSAALNTVIGNRRLEEANNAILRMAEHDYLTSLYNRRGFLRELEHRLKLPENQDQILTLFAMDMDRLKMINDVYGHAEGDTAIQHLANALLAETEGKGICARYGGDEFAFAMIGDRSYVPEVDIIREGIEKTAREMCGPKEYLIGASLGACSCAVTELQSLDQILAEADYALYADKSRRKGRRREDRER